MSLWRLSVTPRRAEMSSDRPDLARIRAAARQDHNDVVEVDRDDLVAVLA